MSRATVVLSEQDLAEFLDGNEEYMDKYAEELASRLGDVFDSAEVEISRNALSDEIDIDGEPDDGTVAEVMNQMGNDLDLILG